MAEFLKASVDSVTTPNPYTLNHTQARGWGRRAGERGESEARSARREEPQGHGP